MDPFVAEIRIFACNFAPNGWAMCNGQIMSISQNTALFSLLGTTYGGDGRTTFALPNLQSSAPVHAGQGPGLSLRDLGENGGEESVTLQTSQMPVHTHTPNALLANPSNNSDPNGLTWANPGGRPAPNYFASAVGTPVTMNASAIAPAGGSQPHNNMMPYLALNFCIALQGVFPPRG